METSLVDSGFKEVSPLYELFLVTVEEFQLVSEPFEFKAKWIKRLLLLFSWMFEEKFEDDVKIERDFVGKIFFALNNIKKLHELGK
jgi:hypothetical protein